jgi:hypothetical protein
MSVKNFKFVSPGVFINEIDNSFIPKSAEKIGPCVIGRSTRGLAMQPVKVDSYSDFVEMFGETVPGKAGGDISRNGNFQSPMYGTYAAKAFLKANVAPLTYIRLLGQQDPNASGAGVAGWQTIKDPATVVTGVGENGGAYGLYIFNSASITQSANATDGANMGNGRLAAVWYVNKSASIQLSGALFQSQSLIQPTGGIGCVVKTDASYQFTALVTSSAQGLKRYKFDFDDQGANFVRKVFNTNPQLASTAGDFYPSSSAEDYWLGESYEQYIRDKSLVGVPAYGVILPIAQNVAPTVGPSDMRQASAEAIAGWFVGQALGPTGSFSPEQSQKLFRLIGRGHGQWLTRNCKVSIANIRKSPTTLTDYGTFSVLIRSISDTDNNIQVMERFDNLTLDPGSPNFIARKIGTQYQTWDTTNKILKTVGAFPNNSKFVYVSMNEDAYDGGTVDALLPWGYFGPPRFKNVSAITGGTTDTAIDDTFVYFPTSLFGAHSNTAVLSGSGDTEVSVGCLTGSLKFPDVRLRISASDGGLSDQKKAYFGMQTTRTANSTVNDPSVPDFHKLPYADFPGDPTIYGSQNPSALSGASAWGYMFSMDDLKKDGTTGIYSWTSGSRAGGLGQAYSTTLTDGMRGFTAPFWGGFDGFDIVKPDPMYNKGMVEGTSTEANDYIYYTWRRAVDTVADPEFIDMNMLSAPGLTLESLTTHVVRTCEERGDALGVIDLPNVFLPDHEVYNSNKANQVGTTPTAAALALTNRVIDTSYGCTFYPWAQTVDEATSRILWIPPSVAMLGVMASSQAASELWFAPAGFNRGGLTDGAAGIPITAVSERLMSKDRDTLYDANINPIASFPSTGIVVFGQKTLQERQSALDRINVRRLVIYMKKQISILSSQILFEQNVQDTWARFVGLIDPFLSNIRTRYGITDYRLILDETTTTPDLIDQNILYAKIMVKPARAIEFIAIDFVIMSTGASFDD